MTDLNWQNLISVNEDAVVAARLQAHIAAQWLGRLATAFIPAQDDYSHTNLGWDREAGGLYTHDLNDSGLRAGLIIEKLILVVGAEDELELDGRTDADVEQWLRGVLIKYNFAADKLDLYMPEELVDHPVAQGGVYNVAGQADAQSAIACWFANADLILQDVAKDYGHIQPGPSPVRCWPHHFDIATLIVFEAGDPETARSIGVGLSPGDNSYGLPYFYVNPWPKPASASLPAIHPIGAWHTQGFFGAVATANRIIPEPDQYAAVVSFMDTAMTANQHLLGVPVVQ
ncbi:MAG: hypothetical protein AAFR90_08520 [Pseudomonadota bacterium]